jgi:hypothetical protein
VPVPARSSALLAIPIAAIPASVRVFCRLLDKITATAKATAHIPNPSALAKVRRTVADAYPDGPTLNRAGRALHCTGARPILWRCVQPAPSVDDSEALQAAVLQHVRPTAAASLLLRYCAR